MAPLVDPTCLPKEDKAREARGKCQKRLFIQTQAHGPGARVYEKVPQASTRVLHPAVYNISEFFAKASWAFLFLSQLIG